MVRFLSPTLGAAIGKVLMSEWVYFMTITVLIAIFVLSLIRDIKNITLDYSLW